VTESVEASDCVGIFFPRYVITFIDKCIISSTPLYTAVVVVVVTMSKYICGVNAVTEMTLTFCCPPWT